MPLGRKTTSRPTRLDGAVLRIDVALPAIGRAEDVVGVADRNSTMSTETLPAIRIGRQPCDKGRIVGQVRPLLPKHVWSIRIRPGMAENWRDLAFFSAAVRAKLRGCDLVC